MKKEPLYFFILFIEIAAIVLLHSTRNRQPEGSMISINEKRTAVTVPYQLKALTVSKVK